MKKAINTDEVREYIESTLAPTQKYQGSWTAPFLLSDVHSLTWILRTADSRFHEGEWVNTRKFSWDIALGDGQRLSQSRFDEFRSLVQQMCFLVRAVPNSGTESTEAHAAYMRTFLIFVRWCVREGERLNVAVEGFRRVDTEVLESFFKSYAEEGVLGVMQFHKQILRMASEECFDEASPDFQSKSLYALSAEAKSVVCEWMEGKNLYSKRKDWLPRHVDRLRLSRLLETDVDFLQGDRFMGFMRQFEPELSEAYPNLCVSTEVRTEFPSHRTITVDEAVSARPTASRISNLVGVLRGAFGLHRHFPDHTPPREALKFARLQRFINGASQNRHTAWMPLEFSLQILCDSLRWVLDFGEEIVVFFTDTLRKFHEFGWLEGSNKEERIRLRSVRDEWVRQNSTGSVKKLNVCGWSSPQFVRTSYGSLRASPTLVDVLQILIGACTIVIAALKPVRMGELESLSRGCIKYQAGDGYWITHRRGKSVEANFHMVTEAPIPSVVACAIQLLSKISTGASSVCRAKEAWASDALYFMPDFSQTEITVKKMGERYIHTAMDLFCDYICLPVDSMGRRWYPRIHEHRKSFLIAFIWCFKFAAIDAARQLVGHADEKHMIAYIAANFPGEQIPEYEAQYITSMLWNFHTSNGRDSGATNLKKLYHVVRRQFKVKDISELRKIDLESWLELQFVRNRIEIVPFFIGVKEAGVSQFAVKVIFHGNLAK